MKLFRVALENIDECIEKLIRAKSEILGRVAEKINRNIAPIVLERLGYKIIAELYTDYEDPTLVEVRVKVEYPRVGNIIGEEISIQNLHRAIEEENRIKRRIIDIIKDIDSIAELIDSYVRIIVEW